MANVKPDLVVMDVVMPHYHGLEVAAEALAMLREYRVLLEPASMELRFADEPLRPKLELEGYHAWIDS